MSAQRKWWFVLVVWVVACLEPRLSAVIVGVREYHGKQVTCLHSGLMGVAKSCGTERFARVFTGTVSSSVEVGDSGEATATTNQACLPNDIQAGDKWLFYLYRDPNSNALVLGYDGPSKPI